MRLPPQTFWSLSLAEWRAMAPRPRAVLARPELENLMQRYPDTADDR
jgi:uncharacterized phage protein (TIGR02216 family)